ncbi:MAG: hypothetical protein ACTSVU_04105 [Promethearchaeota archaeon]
MSKHKSNLEPSLKPKDFIEEEKSSNKSPFTLNIKRDYSQIKNIIFLSSVLLNIASIFIIGIWAAITMAWYYGFFSLISAGIGYFILNVIKKGNKTETDQIRQISGAILFINLFALIVALEFWPIWLISIIAVIDIIVLFMNFIIGQKIDRKLLHESRAKKKK